MITRWIAQLFETEGVFDILRNCSECLMHAFRDSCGAVWKRRSGVMKATHEIYAVLGYYAADGNS
jgi:hypothetical protein